MGIDVRPATVFEDVAAVLGPRNPTSNVCFCLTYRIPSKENRSLAG
ncbi:MAG: GNAT family N-acetyltransferase, partial [Microbacterium sp.]|nr:GNAT family N-acetyltransferase [Microbacterium sp.]